MVENNDVGEMATDREWLKGIIEVVNDGTP